MQNFNFAYSRINPEDEAITIVNSENVSIGGARNISLKQQESESNGGEKSLLVPKVIYLLIKTFSQRKVFSRLFTRNDFFQGCIVYCILCKGLPGNFLELDHVGGKLNLITFIYYQ